MLSVNGGFVGLIRGVSEGSMMFEESEFRFNICGKGKWMNFVVNGCKKVDDGFVKVLFSKKFKVNNGGFINGGSYDELLFDMEDDMKDEDGFKGKMIDEEKRKNFFECNWYVYLCGIFLFIIVY